MPLSGDPGVGSPPTDAGSGPSTPGRVLGVDLGERRIGLALSDPGRVVASPHSVLERSGDVGTDHRAIVAVAREAEATLIVVGLPRSLDGRLGPAARGVLEEVERLRAVAGIPVEVYDERLTTVVAESALRDGRVRRRERRDLVDKVAAALILRDYLEAQR